MVLRTGVTVLGLPSSLTVTQGSRAEFVCLGRRFGMAEAKENSNADPTADLDACIVKSLLNLELESRKGGIRKTRKDEKASRSRVSTTDYLHKTKKLR